MKTWEKTRRQNLVRHKSGRHYARLFLNGKEIWKSLKTSHFSIAEGKLGEIKKEHRKRRNMEIKPGDAKMTMLQAVTLRMKYIEEGVKIKSSILSYWKEIKAALLKAGTMRIQKKFGASLLRIAGSGQAPTRRLQVRIGSTIRSHFSAMLFKSPSKVE